MIRGARVGQGETQPEEEEVDVGNKMGVPVEKGEEEEKVEVG